MMDLTTTWWRRSPTRIRLLICVAAGVVGGLGVGLAAGWRYGLLAGWMLAAALFTVWSWLIISPMDTVQTRAHALREDPGRVATDITLLTGSAASLIAVALLLLHEGNQVIQATLSLASVAMSWTVIHTVFTVRYARLYYSAPAGGIEFNQPGWPKYSDFAYLSFTIGMTFQVSDTNLKKTEIRATALRHALLSYLFGAVILAATINLVAGLGK